MLLHNISNSGGANLIQIKAPVKFKGIYKSQTRPEFSNENNNKNNDYYVDSTNNEYKLPGQRLEQLYNELTKSKISKEASDVRKGLDMMV